MCVRISLKHIDNYSYDALDNYNCKQWIFIYMDFWERTYSVKSI